MSVQFGRWNWEGLPPAPDYLERIGSFLAPYGPDSNETYSKGGATILYRAFHTTKESHLKTQPYVSDSGAVITLDGRLDNRRELSSLLRHFLSSPSSDVAIVGAAYEAWGTNCLARLIGDWALSIWNPTDRFLLLAKDPIGTRHLYYSQGEDQVTWSTICAPLALFSGKTFEINEEYIAGWLALSFPASHISPCVGIHSVPPSSFVLLRPGKHVTRKYWDFDPTKQIRYHDDAEYEEHFRALFSRSVRSRLRSDSPVLSELSGGRDSSSIVCVADTLISSGAADIPHLDTISYYDEAEPNWNEQPYFTMVEEKRGRTGWHIDTRQINSQDYFGLEASTADPYCRSFASPGYDGRTPPEIGMCLTSQGNRVVLSGVGGDEIMGGVPTASPQLADLLARARFVQFAHAIKAWALEKRKPWFYVFLEVARVFFPPRTVGASKDLKPAPWLKSEFVKRHWETLTGYPCRTRLFGALPSFQENLATLNSLRRQVACYPLPFDPPFEKRYPYLDRELLEFIFAIPRDQLVRPGQRRSLMRRALIGIVPDQILNRKRKAFVTRAPLVAISENWEYLLKMSQNMMSSSFGIVDQGRLFMFLEKARRGEQVPMYTLRRTIQLEGWLRTLYRLGLAHV